MKLQTEKCPILPQQRAFGQEVCMKRSQCGFTQEQMAEYLSISVGEYKKIECCGHIPKQVVSCLFAEDFGLNHWTI